MKITATFKTPDVLDDPIQEAVAVECDDLGGVTDPDLIEEKCSEARKALEKWVRYGELVTIEFDTEAGTATVLPP